MQAIALTCSLLLVLLDLATSQSQVENSISLYTKRYEHLDIDTILASPRLVTNYVDCLLNKKPCAPEGKELKRILPEALRTKCGRCHPSQKEIALKVITALYFDYPQYYKALREKWDPTGEYNRRFEEYLRDQKFNSIGGSPDSEPGEQAQGSSFSINITQRPTRQGDVKPTTPSSSDDLPDILNRFGGADTEDGYDYVPPKPTNLPSSQNPQTTQKPSQPEQPKQPVATSAPSRRPSNSGSSISSGGSSKPAVVPPNPPSSSSSGNTPTQTWAHPNMPAPGLSTTTTYFLKTQNPVLNIINRITMKFANKAEFIAGMFRGAVPQPQKATKQNDDIFKKFCDMLKKVFFTHTQYVNQRNQYQQ